MGILVKAITELGGLVAPGWGGPRLSVLIFHRVTEAADPLVPGIPTRAAFRHKMELLRDNFKVMPLTEGVRRLAEGSLPSRALSITFDDGYRDNVTTVLPVLKSVGVPATFFVASGYLNGGRMWNDDVIEIIRQTKANSISLPELGIGPVSLRDLTARRAAIDAVIERLKEADPKLRQKALDELACESHCRLPDDLMMTDDDVRTLHEAGMEIGCHTRTHPILTRIPLEVGEAEITGSRADLERIINSPVRLFAFPNGIPGYDYDARHVDMVRRLGFEAAFSTAWGVSTSGSDRYQLPRFTPWDDSPLAFTARLILSRRQTRYAVS